MRRCPWSERRARGRRCWLGSLPLPHPPPRPCWCGPRAPPTPPGGARSRRAPPRRPLSKPRCSGGGRGAGPRRGPVPPTGRGWRPRPDPTPSSTLARARGRQPAAGPAPRQTPARSGRCPRSRSHTGSPGRAPAVPAPPRGTEQITRGQGTAKRPRSLPLSRSSCRRTTVSRVAPSAFVTFKVSFKDCCVTGLLKCKWNEQCEFNS